VRAADKVVDYEGDEQPNTARRETLVLNRRAIHLNEVETARRQVQDRPVRVAPNRLQSEHIAEERLRCWHIFSSRSHETDSPHSHPARAYSSLSGDIPASLAQSSFLFRARV